MSTNINRNGKSTVTVESSTSKISSGSNKQNYFPKQRRNVFTSDPEVTLKKIPLLILEVLSPPLISQDHSIPIDSIYDLYHLFFAKTGS